MFKVGVSVKVKNRAKNKFTIVVKSRLAPRSLSGQD